MNNKLHRGNYLFINFHDKLVTAIPTTKAYANARVLDKNEDNSLIVHWLGNYNLNGDFRTELMRFVFDTRINLFVRDEHNTEELNQIREQSNLLPIA